MLNYFSECPSVFGTDAEMNCDEYVDLEFNCFHHYENISYYYLHKHLLPENGKTCPSCMNLVNSDKGKVTTRKILVLKSCSIMYFHSGYYTLEVEKWLLIDHILIFLAKIIVRVNGMTCL